MENYKIMRYLDNNINLLQEKLDKVKITKPQISFLQVINRSMREVVISKYLAFLLDERNTTFKVLEKILTKTHEGVEKYNVNFKESQLEGVYTEFQISKNDRIDIFIKYSNFWIVIENKIFTGESKENQTVRYKEKLTQINTRNLPILYIYLKPKANPSKPSESAFKVLTYEDLYSILDAIKEKDLCQIENYKFLLDFKIHTKEILMKMFNLDTDEMKFYLDNQNKLQNVINAYNKNCKLVKNALVDAFKDRFGYEFEIHETNRYIQVYKKNWDDGIHFELLFKDGENFENIISETDKTFFFCLHTEGKSRNKYPKIKEKSQEEKFKFNSNENIMLSINSIVDKFDNMLIKKDTEIIDSNFTKN